MDSSDVTDQLSPNSNSLSTRPRRGLSLDFLYTAPWWLIALIIIGISIVILLLEDEVYSRIFNQLKEGIGMTLIVSTVAYISAIIIGLVVGLIRSNPPAPPKNNPGLIATLRAILHTIVYNIATFYVAVMRGLPILIVLLIVAFVLVPAIRDAINAAFGITLEIKGSSPQSAIIALAFTYGAFESEVFRAGIQSIGKGQIEAARSLGMNYRQTAQFVILPQAIRRILPPLGNDMIAMIKDSSLVQILAVRDITQIAKTSSGASFRYLETYLVVAFIYLTLTVIGSLLVRLIERFTKIEAT